MRIVRPEQAHRYAGTQRVRMQVYIFIALLAVLLIDRFF